MKHFRHRVSVLTVGLVVLLSSVPGMMAQESTPVPFKASPAASRSLAETFAEQRGRAVPLGDPAMVGDLSITVEELNTEAAEWLNPDGAYRVYRNQQLVNVSLTVRNNGDDPYDVAEEHRLFVVGNRGFYRWLTPGECRIDINITSPETAPLEAGEERTFNACGVASTQDIESLQLWISAPVSTTPAAELLISGAWLNLGEDDPYDPDVISGQMERVADLEAHAAPLDSPASPTDAVAAGDLVYELTSFSSDAIGGITKGGQTPVELTPGQTLAMATFQITNTGDRLLGADVVLFDATGVSAETIAVPVTLSDEPGALLPGGTMERTYMWIVEEGQQSSLAFRLSHAGGAAAASWMLTESSGDFSWNQYDVPIADPASDDDQSPVPIGDSASLLDYNVLITSAAGNGPAELALTSATRNTHGSPLHATIASEGEDCRFVVSDRPVRSLSRTLLPGAVLVVGIECVDHGGETLELTLTDTASDTHTGYFSLLSTDQATPVEPEVANPIATPTDPPATPVLAPPVAATPAATPEATELPASPVAETEETATVTTAANVRSEPSLSGAIITVAAEGEVVTITGDAIEADDYVWIPVLTSNGTAGWIADDFLER